MKSVVKLKERRTERFNAFMERLSALVDVSNDYNLKYANEILSDALDLIKTVVVKEKIGNSQVATNCNKWLNVRPQDMEHFVDKVINGVRDAHLDFIEIELKNTEKQLRTSYFEDAIDEIEEFARPKYEGALKLMLHLAKIKKLQELESELFECKKDMIACIKYNTKIENQMASNNTESSELSDEFIENVMAEELVEV